MKATPLFIFLFFIIISLANTEKSVVDLWLKSKAYDEKTSCLMSVLAKLSSDQVIDSSNPDFTTELKEGVQQS